MKNILGLFLFFVMHTVLGQEIEYAGVYSFGTTPEEGPIGIIYVYPNSENTCLFYLELNRGAPSYNSGAIAGQMIIGNAGEANFTMIKEKEAIHCCINFRFTKDALYIRNNSNAFACGFGHAINAKGTYKRTNKKVPAFFTHINGEKKWFKDMDLKK